MVNPSPRLSRLRARRRARGATVFVVVMAVTLLTAVGLFAAHSATLVDQAAGYDRLANQTRQLAEYAALATTAELGSGTASAYVQMMQSGSQTCSANAGLTGVPCYSMTRERLNARTKELSQESLIEDQSGAVENVIGSGDTQGDFFVELTEPKYVDVGVAGSDLSGTSGSSFRYLRVTATSYANFRPANAAVCTNAVASISGQQSVRAHLIIGPIPQ
jgi:Tfp pilus assembly protein PilX